MNAKVENYRLTANGFRPIRWATLVVFEDGRVVRFMEKLSKKRAIVQAIAIRNRD